MYSLHKIIYSRRERVHTVYYDPNNGALCAGWRATPVSKCLQAGIKLQLGLLRKLGPMLFRVLVHTYGLMLTRLLFPLF